jgi:hypothetical protein
MILRNFSVTQPTSNSYAESLQEFLAEVGLAWDWWTESLFRPSFLVYGFEQIFPNPETDKVCLSRTEVLVTTYARLWREVTHL